MRIVGCLLICILLAGCINQNHEIEKYIKNPVFTLKELEESEFIYAESVVYPFASYIPVSVNFSGTVDSYSFDSDILPIISLKTSQKNFLKRNGFVVIPAGYSQFYEVYRSCKKWDIPVYVTTDSVFHTFHILYDYTLRILETEYFYEDLLHLTQVMRDASWEYYHETGDPACLKNTAYFCVAGRLLDDAFDIPLDVQDIVNEELNLIESHEGFAISPIFGYPEDYSQYRPRGHYTRSEMLEKYFKAMMWYGRIIFNLKSEEETKQAIYIVKAVTDTQTLDMWDAIYEPTVFFVGRTDDLNIVEYKTLAEDVYGELAFSDLQDTQKMREFIGKASEYRSPRISSSWVGDTEAREGKAKGFCFMGQRFVPDSYMFQQLVFPQVGTMGDPRLFPRGLDVMAVLGSERALTHLESEKKYLHYEEQMEALKNEFSSLDSSVWTQNLYWTWLYCLMPLLEKKGDVYPPFMQSDAWADRELYTALGSWTELRHDTILYAKQSYGPIVAPWITKPKEPRFTRGYVEPNPYVYARLASLARMMREGLHTRTLLPPEYSNKLKALELLLLSLKIMSEKELSGEELTDGEYEMIWNIGETLESLITFETAVITETDLSVPIVADVHTGAGMVLEEGVGDVFLIFVVVKVGDTIHVAEGGIFSYYEFTQPMSNRLTDEEWQIMPRPPRPDWTSSFIIQ